MQLCEYRCAQDTQHCLLTIINPSSPNSLSALNRPKTTLKKHWGRTDEEKMETFRNITELDVDVEEQMENRQWTITSS